MLAVASSDLVFLFDKTWFALISVSLISL
jgi:hypothetical protein